MIGLFGLVAVDAIQFMTSSFEDRCKQGYHEGMTEAEISRLLELPRVAITWLPDELLNTEPTVDIYAYDGLDSSNDVCALEVVYGSANEVRLEVRQGYLNILKQGISTGNWQCHDVSEYRTVPTCYGDIISPNHEYSVLRVESTYGVETAKQIAESIVLVGG